MLAFARALGEYGATSMIAGYTPGKTATIATTVAAFLLVHRFYLAFEELLSCATAYL